MKRPRCYAAVRVCPPAHELKVGSLERCHEGTVSCGKAPSTFAHDVGMVARVIESFVKAYANVAGTERKAAVVQPLRAMNE